jgi:type IV pilus biogenesis/stability protein PilW
MFKNILLFAFLFVTACGTAEKRKDEAQLRLNIGTNLLANGSYHSALQELLNAEKDDPDNAVVQNNLGLTYLVLEHPEEARQHILRAIELQPKYSEARNNLGRVDIELGLYEDAARELHQVLNDLTYPSPEKAWVNLGLAYFSQREYTQAENSLHKALEIDRKNCLAYNYFGRSQFEMGHYEDAAKTLDQASKLCQAARFDEPHYYSALTYYKMGQKEQARARIDELLTLYPHGKYNEKATAMRKLIE